MLNDFPSYPGAPFLLPDERTAMYRQFWPVRWAARCWGCSYRAARLYLLRHPDQAALVRVRHSRGPVRWVLCAQANTYKRPSFSGNPDFKSPAAQRRWALLRWQRKKARP